MSTLTPTRPPQELHVKILMIGNSSVGKSSLLMRWSENQWLPEDEASATIGVEVLVSYSSLSHRERRDSELRWQRSKHEVNGEHVNLAIWVSRQSTARR
jgi:GTPase SAR1 family protein